MSKITGDMVVADVLKVNPKTVMVMLEYGFHCFGCHANSMETIEQGAKGHGMPKETYEKMLKDLNSVNEEK